MIAKLEMFIALARERHFGRAAESLGITQPSLSGGIRQLEEQLGVMLVFRGSRFGGLTPEGQRTLEWARRIVGDTRALRDEMRARPDGLSADLRLAVIPTATTWAAHLASRFGARHPNVRFTILTCTATEAQSRLDAFEADACLSYLDQQSARQREVALYRETYVVLCARTAPLAKLERVPWSALADQSLGLLTPDMQNRRIVDSHLAAAGVPMEARVQSNSIVVLAELARQTGWVTVLPASLAGVFDHDALCAIPLEGDTHTAAPVGLICPERDPTTPVLAALMACAKELAQG